MVRKSLLVNDYEPIDFSTIRLKDLFMFTIEDSINFFAYNNCLINEMICDNCSNNMNVQKDKYFPDGRNNKRQCSTKSIRSSSFFKDSKLSMSVSLQLFYMWAQDFDNKQISRELNISPKTIVDWLNMCREICQK
jgi:hypothetical protein